MIRSVFICLIGWFGISSAYCQTTIWVSDANTGARLDFTLTIGKQEMASQNKELVLDIKESTIVSITSTNYIETTRRIEPKTKYLFYLNLTITELNAIVVTDVHRQNRSHETVLNVSRIQAKKLEELGAVDLRDALTFQNNIRISRDNALGSSGLSLMGMSGNNVKLMVDGVPVIGRLLDQLDLEQFNLENTQQIEIIKGPMSVIYGSNALAGTINIITNKGGKKQGSIKAYHETDGQYNTNGTLVIPYKKHSFSLSGGRLFFDGWSADQQDRTFDWIPKEQYNGRFAYQYYKDSFQIAFRSEVLFAYLLDRGAPLAPYKEFAVDQKYHNQRLDNSVNIIKTWKHSNLNVIAGNNYFKRLKNKYYKNLVDLSEQLIPISTEQDTQKFNAAVIRAIYGFNHGQYETLVGSDINQEYGWGRRLDGGEQAQLDVALFSSTELKVGKKVKLRTGLRYAYNSAFQSPLLYSLQSRISLRNDQQLKLAYGKGFRAPSLKELYLDFTDSRHNVYGNNNLLPETSHSITASYQRYKRKGPIALNSTAELFFNHIENKIDLLVLGPIEATYGNIGIFETVGGSLSQQAIYKNLSMNLSFNYTGTYNGINQQEKKYNFSPQWVVQAAYSNKEKGFSINMYLNYFGKINRVYSDTATGEQSINTMDDYTMLDLTINKHLLHKRLTFTSGLRNLFQVQTIAATTSGAAHTESVSAISISPGRTFFISLRYAFIKP